MWFLKLLTKLKYFSLIAFNKPPPVSSLSASITTFTDSNILVSLIIFQTFIHIGVNANLLPSTGMTLPFLSYGGSSLLSTGIIAGIILNYTSLTEKN